MTDEELTWLEMFERKATPGTWGTCLRSVTADGVSAFEFEWQGQRVEDAMLIAAARNALPKLIAALREARAERDRATAQAEEAVRRLEVAEVEASLLRHRQGLPVAALEGVAQAVADGGKAETATMIRSIAADILASVPPRIEITAVSNGVVRVEVKP